MLDQLKRDRLAQVLLVVTILVGCFAVTMAGIAVYTFFTRQQQVARPSPQTRPLNDQVKESVITLLYLHAAISALRESPPESENQWQEMGEFMAIQLFLQTALDNLEQEPPPGLEAAWGEARAAGAVAKEVYNQALHDEITADQVKARLEQPQQQSQRAIQLAGEALKTEYGATEETMNEIGREVQDRLEKAGESPEQKE